MLLARRDTALEIELNDIVGSSEIKPSLKKSWWELGLSYCGIRQCRAIGELIDDTTQVNVAVVLKRCRSVEG